jgi:gentisate 1,2-dioxygenase
MPPRPHRDGTLAQDAQYFEYTKAANPIAAGYIPKIPLADFPASLHESGGTRVVPFDLSGKLGTGWPATNPSLLASYVRMEPGGSIGTRPDATSQLFHVIRGSGTTAFDGEAIAWRKGDTFVLPFGGEAVHAADGGSDAAFYFVHDEPLLRYLGARPDAPRFRPTLYAIDREQRELSEVAADPEASSRNRVSILLGNARFPQTRTITHVLWAMFGVLPKGKVQPAHKHESIALDFIIDCRPGCYTLIGEELDGDGRIKNGTRAEWKGGSAFVTPPGLWHSHHNESGEDAHLLPIQDAGLHTHLRTLDIHFASEPRHEVYISQKI